MIWRNCNCISSDKEWQNRKWSIQILKGMPPLPPFVVRLVEFLWKLTTNLKMATSKINKTYKDIFSKI
jgi:phage-related minor tail protein